MKRAAPDVARGSDAHLQSKLDQRLWVERLWLTNFRNYASVSLELGPRPIVLTGPNGVGKTNLLEAVSLLAPGQGLRSAPFPDLARAGGDGSWAVAARVHGREGALDIGTGLMASVLAERSGRVVRIDGLPRTGSGALADHVEMVWVTPAMDGLFTGPSAERRRFLDRLILCFDPAYRTRAGAFERAMRSRNRLLADGVRDAAQFRGLEIVMAEAGVAVAAARSEAVAALGAMIANRRVREASAPFPWAEVALDGMLEADLARRPAVEVEEAYASTLRHARERDRAAGRTLDGPHRSDLAVMHGPKAIPAKLCSTGEQKALLLGLVLAHAELVALRKDGRAPILLLDEIAAHFDVPRREALFAELVRLGAQAWLTGTDESAFEALSPHADFWRIEDAHPTALAVPARPRGTDI